jgi:RNA polymerase sigma-70 factor (ECF subfamily)
MARAFAAREEWALAETYRRYAPLLYSVALRVLGETSAAEDCVHDTILRLWERAHSYRVERGALRAFLVVAVRNDALSRLRTSQRRLRLLPRLFNPETADDPMAYVEDRELREQVEALPPEQRDIVRLAYFNGFTHVEAARELNVPLGTVKSRLNSALRRLASSLGGSQR